MSEDEFTLTPPERDPRVARGRRPSGEIMRRIHGPGPEGAKCGTCAHLIRKRFANVYFKCALYGKSRGPYTDWRARWPACGKYEKEPRP